MKNKLFAFAIMVSVFSGCKKDEEPATNNTTSVECSSILPNKLSAKIDGQSWCADQTCFGDLAIIMTMNGLNSNGSSLTLELDDFNVGTYPIKQDRNHMLYTGIQAYESTDGNPGTLVIQSNDTSANLIKGTFTVTLVSPILGSVSMTDGKFSIYYTE